MVLSFHMKVVSRVIGRKFAFIGTRMSDRSSSLPSNAHLPATWKSNTSPYATSGGVPESSAATTLGTDSCGA